MELNDENPIPSEDKRSYVNVQDSDWKTLGNVSKNLRYLLPARMAVYWYHKTFLGLVDMECPQPPEAWYTPAGLNKVMGEVPIPRKYTPVIGFPVLHMEGQVMFMAPGTQETGINAMYFAIDEFKKAKTNNWVYRHMVPKYRSARGVEGTIASLYRFNYPSEASTSGESTENLIDCQPLHAFNATVYREFSDTDPKRDEFWILMYSGINTNTRLSGIYGWLQNNTLIDTRPFEDGANKNPDRPDDEYNPDLRTELVEYAGFVGAIYTPSSTEAGRMRGVVAGVRYRHIDTLICERAEELIDAAQFFTNQQDEAILDCLYKLDPDMDWDPENENLFTHVLRDQETWKFYFSGVVVEISLLTVELMIQLWVRQLGPQHPSLHVFPEGYVVLSIAPGCLMRPMTVSDFRFEEWKERLWVDSFIFNDDEQLAIYGLQPPPPTQAEEYSRAYFSLVPYLSFNTPPRPSLACGMSPQAISRPYVETLSTVYLNRSSSPILRTPLMDIICKDIEGCDNLTLPGHHLLTVFMNHSYNYEDGIIVSEEVIRSKIFDHTGFVNHPIFGSKKGKTLNKEITDDDTWCRPTGRGVIVGVHESATKGGYVTILYKDTPMQQGDKVATDTGQKSIVVRVMSKDELPWCICQKTGRRFQPHVIMAATSVHNRGTVGQIYGAWRTLHSMKKHIKKTFPRFKLGTEFPPCVMDYKSFRHPPKEEMHYTCKFTHGGTNKIVTRTAHGGTKDQRADCIADYGVVRFNSLVQLARDRQHYASQMQKKAVRKVGRILGGTVKGGEADIMTMDMLGLQNTLQYLIEVSDSALINICSVCRRQSILCDCKPGVETKEVKIVMRHSFAEYDICRALVGIVSDDRRRSLIESTSTEVVASSFVYN